MKIKDIKNLSEEDLVSKEKEIKKELYALNNQRQLGGRAEKPAEFKKMRRTIARIQTLLNERKSNGKKS